MSSISIPSCLTLARLNANGVINSVPHLQLPITVATPSHLSKRLRFFTVSREVKAFAHNGIGITNSVPPRNGTYTVGDFMTKKEDLHAVKTTTTVDEALERLVEKRITGFPVIDDDWKLTFNELQRLLSKTNGKVVGDLMTPAPLVVHENTNLEDAARLLLETKYRRLPVVDGYGKLVGLITRGNVVRAALQIKRDGLYATNKLLSLDTGRPLDPRSKFGQSFCHSRLLILEHESVGGLMSHFGWNSTSEGNEARVKVRRDEVVKAVLPKMRTGENSELERDQISPSWIASKSLIPLNSLLLSSQASPTFNLLILLVSMDSKSSPVEMFFFPYVGGGHQIPMVDIARIFAAHGAKSTIITSPKHARSFQQSINRNQQSGLPITIKTLHLPDDIEIPDTDMSATPRTDTSMLQEPLKSLLLDSRPDCIVHDMFHHWSADVINSMNIPRIVFNGNCCFSRCVLENVRKYKPHEKVSCDYEPFVVPGLPDKIELTSSQLPVCARQQEAGSVHKMFAKPEEKSFGIVVNSFYDLEPAYVEYFKQDLGNDKAWFVGPVSLCNSNIEDKAERGHKTSIDEGKILSFLDSKETNSVLYISFGSLARLAPEQLLEIAYGLEASNHSFIWVVGKIFQSPGTRKENGIEENWLPSGFEERMRESKRGLIIRGWAPQLLILEHAAVGGFMTHCGWNSTLESVSAGVPMVTWPITAEQFSNEKLISDVLKIGVKVGSVNWVSWSTEPSAAVGRDKVEVAVKRLMGTGEEAAEMRRRAGELGEKAKNAVEEGGSSFIDAEALLQELKSVSRI
ncbi:UDP-glycosyltransferase 73B4 [Citrus sinensis]|nr:UDP-glycosyltransferase 73B4 [Citrus sinensis]